MVRLCFSIEKSGKVVSEIYQVRYIMLEHRVIRKVTICVCVSVVLLLGSIQPVAAQNQSITYSSVWESPSDQPQDLTTDGTHLWLIGSEDRKLYKIDPANGNVLEVISHNVDHDQTRGLAWDGINFWISTYYEETGGQWIYAVSPDGIRIDEQRLRGWSYTWGLTYMNQSLWASTFGGRKLYQLDPNTGQTLGYFTSPGSYPQGLVHHAGDLWHVDSGTDKLYKINPADGTILSDYELPWSEPRGLTWLNGRFYIADAATHKIYAFNLTTPGERVDVWIADPAPDAGEEPNTVSRNVWTSPDVWVRNQDDGVYQYQNAKFGQDNYVYARVRNRGMLTAQNTVVEVYRINATLGSGWPKGWTLVGKATIETLAPNAAEVVSIRWKKDEIPRPGHYCFYIRLINADDPMTFPETGNAVQNTFNNNNIAWRNFNVVKLVKQVKQVVELNAENPGDTPVTIDLVFEEEELLLNHGGQVFVNLGDLFDRWTAAGSQGENVAVANGNEVQLLTTPAKIAGIQMDAEEIQAIQMRTEAFEPMPGEGTTREYQFSVQEFIQGELVGGVDYIIVTRAQDADSDGDGIKDVDDDDDDNDGIPDSEDEDPIDPSNAKRRILDNYIGGGDERDVVGEEDEFGVNWMEVDVSDNFDMTVDINTFYVEGASGTAYGDLFISADGWNPYGESPYTEDDYTNGEVWEYVFDVSSGSLYDIRDAQEQILLSDDIFLSGHRPGHEVLIDPAGLTAIGQGTAEQSGNLYSLNFNIADFFLDTSFVSLGLSWSMTCANDMIQGYAGKVDGSAVPEPGTLLLLGSGLVGAFVFGRKRMKK